MPPVAMKRDTVLDPATVAKKGRLRLINAA